MSERPTLSNFDHTSIVKRYSERFAVHGATVETLNVGSLEKYTRQHEIHYSLMPPGTESVTDVGCGVALFYAFLKRKGRRIVYNGIDIVPAFTESNIRSYPEAAFETRDVFSDGLGSTPDHVVMCQVFNNRFRDSDNLTIIKRAMELTFSASRMSISVDMLSRYVTYEEPHLYYYDPAEVFSFAKKLTPFVTLRHDYTPHHFTVSLYKECMPESA